MQYEQDHEILDLQRQLLDSQNTAEALKDTVGQLQTQLSQNIRQSEHDSDSLRSRLESITSDAEKTRQELEHSRSTETVLRHEIERLRAEAGAEIERWKSDAHKMRDEYDDWKASAKTDAENVRQEISRLLRQIEELEAEMGSRVDRLNLEASQLRHDNENLRVAHRREVEKLINDRERAVNEVKTVVEGERADELLEYQKEMDVLRSCVADWEKKSNAVRQTHESQLETLNGEISSLNRRISHLDDENAELKRAVEVATAKRDELYR